MIAQEPIFLDCPFSEKDEAKKLGAQFDWDEKKWFIPPEFEIEAFAKWLPQIITTDDAEQDSLTLYDLMSKVQTTIAEQHNTRYWVRAEIVSLSANVHVYLELSDHDSEGNEVAKARATLWNYRADGLLEHFEEQTGMTFKAGLKVLLQVRVEFHPRYGFSLDILDIDATFTLGEMEAKLNRIRTMLKREEIYDKNQLLESASEFCKVAVIAPKQAAGLGDFKSQADILEALGLCEFHYYPARFQGQNMIIEIPAAFKAVNQAHQTEQFDAVVVIRGGGAKANLFQLNEYDIAKSVCTAQLPVIIGIGHERDKTLLDEVANHACHTPSLVITHIASTIIQNAQNAEQLWQTFLQLTGEILNNAKAENDRFLAIIREQTIRLLAMQRQELDSLIQTVKNASQNQLNQASHQIKLLMEQVLLGDPKTILNRGYAIVRNKNNVVITNKVRAQEETSLIIEFKDGRINCQRGEE